MVHSGFRLFPTTSMQRGGGGAGGEECPALPWGPPGPWATASLATPRLHLPASQGRVVSLNLSGFDQAFRPGAERLPPMTVSSKRLHFDTNPRF